MCGDFVGIVATPYGELGNRCAMCSWTLPEGLSAIVLSLLTHDLLQEQGLGFYLDILRDF